MKNKRDFAVFILTHGRADNVITYRTLRNQGYTGKVYLVIDNMDDQADRYRENFGIDKVIVFDKKAEERAVDTVDNGGKMGVILFARNACFHIAKDLGLTHFLELDDDYTDFSFRYNNNGAFSRIKAKNLDSLFEAFLDCLDETNADTVAMAQGGDFIAGLNGANYRKRVLRKAMNSFFCRTDKPFQFIGRINEDVNTYTLRGSQGMLMFTATEASLEQLTTQTNKGGMTETYLDSGTYLKTFYTVVLMPSAVKVSMMGSSEEGHRGHYRIHHHVNWDYCVPCILEESYKK